MEKDKKSITEKPEAVVPEPVKVDRNEKVTNISEPIKADAPVKTVKVDDTV